VRHREGRFPSRAGDSANGSAFRVYTEGDSCSAPKIRTGNWRANFNCFGPTSQHISIECEGRFDAAFEPPAVHNEHPDVVEQATALVDHTTSRFHQVLTAPDSQFRRADFSLKMSREVPGRVLELSFIYSSGEKDSSQICRQECDRQRRTSQMCWRRLHHLLAILAGDCVDVE